MQGVLWELVTGRWGGQTGLVDAQADRCADNGQVGEFFNAHHKVHSLQKLPIWY